MSTTKLWTDWGVKIGTTVVDGVQSAGVTPALRTLVEGGDGSPYNTHGALAGGSYGARFATNDLKALLDLVGLTGVSLASSNLTLFWQRFAASGTRDALASGTHISTVMATGLLVWRSITMAHQQTAQIECEAFPVSSNGSAAPVTFDEAASLTAGTYPAVSAAWTLGPVKLNATTVDGLESARIDSGIDVVVEGADSDIWPTFATIRKIQPSVVLTGAHADVTSTLTEAGAYYTASQVVLYARQRAEGGTYTADGSSVHVKFTLGKCRVDVEGIAGDPKRINLRLTPWYTAGVSPTLPIVVATASAIT